MNCAKPPQRAAARPSSAFTLVELLVVIGIIALLMSILLPTLGNVRERANVIKCGSNLRQIGLAFTMYLNESKGRFPDFAASRSSGAAGRRSDWIYWQQLPTPRELGESAVLRYLGTGNNPQLLRCPADDWTVRPLNGNAASVGPYVFSYAANVYLMSNGQIPAIYNGSFNVARVRNQSEKILAVEEDERTLNDGTWMGAPIGNVVDGPPNDFLSIRHERTRFDPDNAANWARNIEKRGNVVFLDGHYEYLSRREAHKMGRLDPYTALR